MVCSCQSHTGNPWRFPKIEELPLKYPCYLGFPVVNHPAIGVPAFLEPKLQWIDDDPPKLCNPQGPDIATPLEVEANLGPAQERNKIHG